MTDYTDSAGNKCSMVDECAISESVAGAYNLLMDNFMTHYKSNRSPFPVFMHAAWLVRYPSAVQGNTLSFPFDPHCNRCRL